MIYFWTIGGGALLQALFSFALISASSGNGSFVGLGAMLLAVIGIPVTAIINTLLIRSHRNNPATRYVGRVFFVLLLLPLVQLALLILVSVFRL